MMTSVSGGVSAGEIATWACPIANAIYLRQDVESSVCRQHEQASLRGAIKLHLLHSSLSRCSSDWWYEGMWCRLGG
uniref:Uncharacterized protein n=1 Tax=Setaria viridis TaxID=4556 RepID=A0A4U6UAT2_SETVI|nr:hypothetical protein SEVIR_6G209550v2 [Setaria viridis]